MSRMFPINTQLAVVAKKNKEATVSIKDYIGEYFQIDENWNIVKKGVSAKDFTTQIDALIAEGINRVNIEINSGGGDIYDGDEIVTYIQNKMSEIEIHTYNIGIAASMASGILCAVPITNRHAFKHSKVMIHNANTQVNNPFANATWLREKADVLDVYDESLSVIYADSMGLTKEEFMSQYMNGKDHFFTAEQAKELKIIGVIENQDAKDVPAAKNLTELSNHYQQIAASMFMQEEKPSLLQKMKDMMSSMIKDEMPKYATQANNQIIQENKNDKEMNAEEIQALIDKSVDAKIKPVQDSLDATKLVVEDKDKEIEKLRAELETAKKTATTTTTAPIAKDVNTASEKEKELEIEEKPNNIIGFLNNSIKIN